MTITKKKEVIKLSARGRDSLARELGVTTKAIYDALAFRSDSPLSEKIRREALNNYGGVKTEKIIFYDERKVRR